MTCDDLVRGDTLEAYVAGGLDEQAQADVERHVFECEACAARLDDLMTVRAVLAEPRAEHALVLPPRRLSTAWYGQPLAIAAGVATLMFSAAGAIWWMGTGGRAVPQAATAEVGTAPAEVAAPVTAPAQVAAAPAPAMPAPDPARAPAPMDWVAFARFDAPALLALTLRGAASAEPEAGSPHTEAVAAYRAGRFEEAARAFAAIVGGAELPPAVAFYRGVSRLKSGNVAAGLEDLQAAADSVEAPYAIEAHLYLAYGHLMRQDVARADAALARYIELDGDFTAEARGLRQRLARIAPPPR